MGIFSKMVSLLAIAISFMEIKHQLAIGFGFLLAYDKSGLQDTRLVQPLTRVTPESELLQTMIFKQCFGESRLQFLGSCWELLSEKIS